MVSLVSFRFGGFVVLFRVSVHAKIGNIIQTRSASIDAKFLKYTPPFLVKLHVIRFYTVQDAVPRKFLRTNRVIHALKC